jgi:hypothetical protein
VLRDWSRGTDVLIGGDSTAHLEMQLLFADKETQVRAENKGQSNKSKGKTQVSSQLVRAGVDDRARQQPAIRDRSLSLPSVRFLTIASAEDDATFAPGVVAGTRRLQGV